MLSQSIETTIFFSWVRKFVQLMLYNLFVPSKKQNHEFTNSRIQSAAKEPESLLNHFLILYYFLFITLKIIFSQDFHFKAL